MAQQGNEPKVLRIGVIQSGKVIEERLIRKHAPISIGSDSKNTFVIDGEGVPKTWTLFDLKGTTYSLVFADGMDGRVSVDDNNVDFGSLKAQNLVQKQGDKYRLPLNESSRGRVQLGSELTILFHFVAAPPVAAKPELPLSAKGGWVKSIEPVFTSVLIGSFLIHALMTIIVFNVEPPPRPSIEDVKRLIARVTPQKVEVPPAKPEPIDEGPKDDGPAKQEKKEEPKESGEKSDAPKAKGSAADQARAAEERRKEVQAKIAGKGLLAVIGASGDGAGAIADVFGSGSSVGNLSTDLEGTGGVGIAGSGSDITRRGEGGGGGGGAADIGSLGTGGGGAVETGAKKTTKVTASVSAGELEGVDGTVDKKGVSRVLKKQSKAFQACYETALKTNSKLRGKVVVEFTINERGQVADVRLIKDDLGSPEFKKCFLSAFRRLRFPKPEDGEVTITNSFVFQPGG